MRIITIMKSISILYEQDKTWISKIINTFYKEKLYEKGATSVKYALVRLEGNRSVLRNVDVYNLDIILSIGAKLNSNNGLLLKQYIDEQLQNQIIPIESNKIRFIDGELSIDVQLDETNQTVWLNQNQIALLFDTTQQNISLHINNICDENELDLGATHKEYLLVQIEGGREVQRAIDFYNLDMILAIGYRVKGKKVYVSNLMCLSKLDFCGKMTYKYEKSTHYRWRHLWYIPRYRVKRKSF